MRNKVHFRHFVMNVILFVDVKTGPLSLKGPLKNDFANFEHSIRHLEDARNLMTTIRKHMTVDK